MEIGGRKTRPAQVIDIIDNGKEFSFTLIIQEGMNRQIHRMMESLGYKVMKLKRIAIGNLILGQLACGKFRKLTTLELRQL